MKMFPIRAAQIMRPYHIVIQTKRSSSDLEEEFLPGPHDDQDSEENCEVDETAVSHIELGNNGDSSDYISHHNVESSEYGPEAIFPRRNRCPPQKWFIASTASHNSQSEITTSDDPTLKEAMYSTTEEQALCKLSIDD